MALIQLRLAPSASERRWFGLVLAAFFGVLGGLFALAGGLGALSWTLWGIGLGLCLLYYALRPLRRPMYTGWMRLVYPLGWVISHVFLALFWILLITPMGLVMRLSGRDPLGRRIDRAASSHWTERPPAPAADHYFKQF